jgi:hypothetical protein
MLKADKLKSKSLRDGLNFFGTQRGMEIIRHLGYSSPEQ